MLQILDKGLVIFRVCVAIKVKDEVTVGVGTDDATLRVDEECEEELSHADCGTFE